MNVRFVPITSTEGIDELLRQSEQAPVLLLNHDPKCPISMRAYREVVELPYEVALVDVAADTAVTHYVSERTGVKHESPQVILFHQGDAVWSASHFAITERAIEQVLQTVA